MFENVDIKKLTRDYSINPLQKDETLDKKDLLYLFCELNFSREEVGKFLNIGVPRVRKFLKLYNLKKDPKLYLEKSKRTCLKKYGVSSPLLSKKIQDKIHDTNLKKYGVINPFGATEIKEKIYKTNIEKYGSKNPQSNKEIKQKSIDTIRQKYGISNGMQLHINNKDIWFDNSKLVSFIKEGDKGSKWRTIDLAEIFNVSVSTVQVKIGELDLWKYITTHTSTYEDEIESILLDWGFSSHKYRSNKLELDIVVDGTNVAIEFNGNYWHSTRVRKDIYYHKNKTLKALEQGYFLYHIFEYEWNTRKDKVLSHLKNILKKNTASIFARKCIIKEVDTQNATKFIDTNHIQGYAPSSIKLGLYYNDELVSLMTFGKSRFNKNYQYELVRFCSKAGYNVVGGASKLFKYFIKTYNPKSIISYSDIAKTTGKIYDTLGFKTISESEPNYVWVYRTNVYTRYQCQKHRLVKLGFGNKNQTEKEIMESKNYAQVYDCGNRTHVWVHNLEVS